MKAHHTHAGNIVFAVGCNHSTLTGSEGFCGIETESGQLAETSYSTTAVLGRKGVRGVFDEMQLVITRKRVYFIHVTRLASHVNRNDCPSLRCNLPSRSRYVDVQRNRVDINKNWTSPEI